MDAAYSGGDERNADPSGIRGSRMGGILRIPTKPRHMRLACRMRRGSSLQTAY